MTVKKSDITCPHCGKTGTWQADNSFRPFCSERCKLIDLGDWASERHRVAGDPASPDDINKEQGEE